MRDSLLSERMEHLEQARELHQKHPVADAHFDLAAEVYARRMAGERNIVKDRYLRHFRKAGCSIIVSSVFVYTKDLKERGLQTALAQIGALREDLDTVSDEICVIGSGKELDTALEKGKIAVLLSMEGLDPIGTDLHLLRVFYDLGVRGAGLTWSRPNAFGTGCCRADEMEEIPGGLTDLGKEAIRRMEALGMYLDVSHLNNEGFADVLKCAKAPFIASHSNAWEICRNYRNLRDDQIQALAERGGVIGLNANCCIAGAVPGDKSGALLRLCEHVEHLVSMAGVCHVGYGFDLCDGLDAAMAGTKVSPDPGDLLKNHEEAMELTAALLSRGMEEEAVMGIIGGNFLEFFRRVLR
ncbi:MAG: membrane dipeptidase [Lachnospiraceae bacterium]|nr:membrane dipeptidase [Lachnospiraceae bacterium]